MLDAKEVLFGFGGIGDDLIVASVYVDCDVAHVEFRFRGWYRFEFVFI